MDAGLRTTVTGTGLTNNMMYKESNVHVGWPFECLLSAGRADQNVNGWQQPNYHRSLFWACISQLFEASHSMGSTVFTPCVIRLQQVVTASST